ncbi:MAG TPA: acetate--CoA ligase family protein, partial [Candidatus Limnocylindrales bacterium]|nr:acetate--CoA ligase family protein [Candidatus Limnocylindrales bacterium]
HEKSSDLVHPEKLSFITQSGGLGGIIYQMVLQLSVGFNYFVSTGNEADVSFAEVLYDLVCRNEVTIVAGYMEGLQGDGCLFIEACRYALQERKLITMFKAGRTISGAAAAASHTGALVGEDAVYDGVFKQFGVPRSDDVEQMNALIALYAAGRMPKGKKIAVITISGGGGVVVADKCPEYGLEVVPLSDATQNGLREFFPSYGAVGNPVDLTSQLMFDTTLFQKAIRQVMQDPEIDIGGFFYNLEMPDPAATQKIIEVYREVEKPLVIFTWPTGQDYGIESKKALVKAGVPVIEHIPSGLWAISALADWVRKSEEPQHYPAYTPGKELAKSLEIVNGQSAASGGGLTEWRSKRILEAYGIPVTREKLACSKEEAVKAAEEIGYPVVLKIMASNLLHKTEAGGVVLNVADRAGVEKAFGEIVERARSYDPDAIIDGVLIQEMLEPGLEVIIGIKRDPVFGPAIMFGLGGIFVEVLRDVAIRIAPLRENDARTMIADIKGKALLEGVRGQKPRDIEALVSILMKLSRLAVDMGDLITEMDINPLILYEEGKGAVAADALFVLKQG